MTASREAADFIDLLNHGLRAHEVRLERRHVDTLAGGWPAWRSRQDNRETESLDLLAARYLQSSLNTLILEIARLREAQGNFTRRYGATGSLADKRRVILDFSRELGASRADLRGDARAFGRWFGPDAMQDRVRIRISQAERAMVFHLQSIGRTGSRYLRSTTTVESAWSKLAVEETVLPLLSWDGDARVRFEAFHVLSTSIQELSPDLAAQAIGDTTTTYVYRAALDHHLDVWIQREALLLLRTIDLKRFIDVIRHRLTNIDGSDDMFVRRYAIELLGAAIAQAPQLDQFYILGGQDASAFVRQGTAQAMIEGSDAVVRQLWPVLGLADSQPQVRATALMQLPVLACRPALASDALQWLDDALRTDTNLFVLRVGLNVAEDSIIAMDGQQQPRWIATLLPRIESLHTDCPLLMVRRWAAQTRERIVCRTTPDLKLLAERLATIPASCRPGSASRLADTSHTDDEVGRVLAVLTQRDHGIGLERTGAGWRAWRGHRFGFRLWRLLHEWRNPSPDKRQAFDHTIGRIFRGTVRAPSGILGELAQTKVPGEPLHMASEAGWRPYLPLVDELISLLDESASDGPLRLYTAEGVTEVDAPAGMARRLAARTTLTRNFEKFAGMRNWIDGSSSHPASYLRTMSEIGFRIRFRVYPASQADSAVTRFFPAIAGVPFPELSNRIQNYFFSAYDNTLFDLTLFIGLAIIGFIGHHVWVNERMRRARNGIPLVVGGWGTRGKSGTERLKAAMFNAQGYSIVSKTTGCEAMFVYSPQQGELREMFLFRPYDKATIWEQYNVVRLANRLGCDVFLWECMALTPAFVRLLQRAWMRDDIVTLTNTFPDHEDLQGPAGINIPQVMTEFIPKGRVLLTTEEQMRPILQTAADDLGTQLKGVGWLESGLITSDILDRFPYQEHPDNIALVAALGAELGIGHDFAVKAMADRVVPDLGVLKTFPPARIDTRTLEFSNGMSANERYGCLGNWKRLLFDRHDPDETPGILISTVVNNRADRIARSRVFAGVLVEDIRADFHVLIGSNLDGFRGYLRETWDRYAQTLTLWPEQGSEGGAGAVLSAIARSHRIVCRPTQVTARLAIMLDGIGAPAELVAHAGEPSALSEALLPLGLAETGALLAFHQRDVTMQQGYAALEARCEAAASTVDQALNLALREKLWAWFDQRIIVVEDYYSTGEAVIATIRDATPPGFHNRIMGMQNIKGTGLDFVYRWLAWDACHRACDDMLARDPVRQRRGLGALVDFQEYGLLSQEKVHAAVAAVELTPAGQLDRTQAEMAVIVKNLNAAMQKVVAAISMKRSAGWKETILNWFEGFLDAGDAVRRRRRSDRIYKDLIKRRISETRAMVELQGLTRRQKGGWFLTTVDNFLKRFS